MAMRSLGNRSIFFVAEAPSLRGAESAMEIENGISKKFIFTEILTQWYEKSEKEETSLSCSHRLALHSGHRDREQRPIGDDGRSAHG